MVVQLRRAKTAQLHVQGAGGVDWWDDVVRTTGFDGPPVAVVSPRLRPSSTPRAVQGTKNALRRTIGSGEVLDGKTKYRPTGVDDPSLPLLLGDDDVLDALARFHQRAVLRPTVIFSQDAFVRPCEVSSAQELAS